MYIVSRVIASLGRPCGLCRIMNHWYAADASGRRIKWVALRWWPAIVITMELIVRRFPAIAPHLLPSAVEVNHDYEPG